MFLWFWNVIVLNFDIPLFLLVFFSNIGCKEFKTKRFLPEYKRYFRKTNIKQIHVHKSLQHYNYILTKYCKSCINNFEPVLILKSRKLKS